MSKVSEIYYRGIQIFFRHYLGYEYIFKHRDIIYNGFFISLDLAKKASMKKIDMMLDLGGEDD